MLTRHWCFLLLGFQDYQNKGLHLTFRWRVFFAVKSDRCKELHGCGKERALSLFPNPPEPRVFNHILPQINCGPDEFQLSSFVIVFQLVGWAVVVAALITSINKEQAIAEQAVDSSFIAGYEYDIYGNACSCITDQGECC